MSVKGIFKKLSGIKGIGYIAVGLAAAIILLLIPTGTAEAAAAPDSSLEYRKLLEQNTEELLSEVAGVGKCSVLITLAYGYEYVYAADQTVIGSKEEKSEVTKKYCFDGDGKGLLLREKMPIITGVAVVCPGAPPEAQYRIISLLSALFDIGSNRICVQT